VSAAALTGRRVVVTGGLGLIGSRLARAAATTAAAVVVVDALVPEHGGRRENLEPVPNVEVAELDLTDGAALRPLLDGADVVFNLAGQRSHTDSVRDPLTDLHHNCTAQLSLLEACRTAAPAAHVLFASTRQVYGAVSRIPADESERLAPRDINGIHKIAAERYHALYHRLHAQPTSVLRLTNTYGPGMRIRDARQGFLGAWLRALIRGEEFEVWGGSQLRDFNYVDDVVDAFLRAAAEPGTVGGVYNLGGPDPITLRELADLLVDAAGGGSYRVRPLPPEAAAIDIGDYAGDYGAFTAATGWAPQVGLREGLERTLAFFREHGDAYL
jgi:nucleoside-diphosphate-sugar epimerase